MSTYRANQIEHAPAAFLTKVFDDIGVKRYAFADYIAQCGVRNPSTGKPYSAGMITRWAKGEHPAPGWVVFALLDYMNESAPPSVMVEPLDLIAGRHECRTVVRADAIVGEDVEPADAFDVALDVSTGAAALLQAVRTATPRDTDELLERIEDLQGRVAQLRASVGGALRALP